MTATMLRRQDPSTTKSSAPCCQCSLLLRTTMCVRFYGAHSGALFASCAPLFSHISLVRMQSVWSRTSMAYMGETTVTESRIHCVL